jgi:hypothetical protein
VAVGDGSAEGKVEEAGGGGVRGLAKVQEEAVNNPAIEKTAKMRRALRKEEADLDISKSCLYFR